MNRRQTLKNVSLVIIWAIGGFIAFWTGIFAYAFWGHDHLYFIIKAQRHIDSAFWMDVFLQVHFDLIDWVLIFLVAFVLSYFSKINNKRYLAFLLGAVGYHVVSTVYILIQYFSYYGDVIPLWAVSFWSGSMISLLVVGPFYAWAGCTAGELIRNRKLRRYAEVL